MPGTEIRAAQQFQNQDHFSVNEILEKLDNELRTFASKKVPYSTFPSGVHGIELDEIIQRTRIKLWKALQKGHIARPEIYVRYIVFTEIVDMARRNKRNFCLSIDDYFDIEYGEHIAPSKNVMHNPEDAYEQKEAVVVYIKVIEDVVPRLPPHQQYAILCYLKDCLADIPQLMDILLKYGLNLEGVHWPEDKDELQKLRASASVARKKMRLHWQQENAAS